MYKLRHTFTTWCFLLSSLDIQRLHLMRSPFIRDNLTFMVLYRQTDHSNVEQRRVKVLISHYLLIFMMCYSTWDCHR